MSPLPPPALRPGLEERAFGDLVRVVSPTTGREHLLRSVEWQVAREMDGRRTLEQLERRARRLGLPATSQTLGAFIRELAARGLLEGGPPPPFAMRAWPEEKQRRAQQALVALKEDRYGDARELLEQELGQSPGCEELQALLEGVRRAEVDATSEQDEQWALAEAVRAAGEGLVLPAPPTPLGLPRGNDLAPGVRSAKWRRMAAWTAGARSAKWRRAAAGVALALVAAFTVPLPDSASGECALAPADRAVVRVTQPGRLQRVVAADGARVRRGDLLAELEDPDLAASLESARARRRQAELSLQELQSGPTATQRDRAGAAADRAAAEVQARALRVQQLTAAAEDGRSSGAELDAARRALEVARWEHKAALAALRLLEAGAVEEATARLRAELEEARATEAGLLARQEAGAIRAPRDGELRAMDLPLRVGSWLRAGEALGEVAAGRSFRVEGRVSELDADGLEPGLELQVRLQAAGAPTLVGRVESLGARFEPVAGERASAVRVYGAVEDPSGIAREGMKGRLEIRRGHATAAHKVARWVRHFLARRGA